MTHRRTFVLHSLAAAGLALMPAAGMAADTAPLQAVTNLVTAMEQRDAEAIRAAFAEDASQAYGAGQPRSGERFRAWLESDIIGPGGRVEGAELSADGAQVVVTGRYRNDNGYTSAANFLMVVEDGLITSWQMRY